jgi:hypothetical protein
VNKQLLLCGYVVLKFLSLDVLQLLAILDVNALKLILLQGHLLFFRLIRGLNAFCLESLEIDSGEKGV